MRWSARSISRPSVVLGLLLLLACETSEDREHKRRLEALLNKGAAQREIAQELGPSFMMYEKGTPSWDSLESFLRREPPADLTFLRKNVAQYPKVMYYTTAWCMTWIFLDDSNVIRSYYLSAQ